MGSCGRLAYLDCVGGLAGDMMLAALLDAGAPEQELREVPERLGLDGVELRLERVERHGIGAMHLDVLDHGQRAESGPPRSWVSIRDQLGAAELEETVRSRALAVLGRLAEAEGGIHGVAPEEVHFHELGAVDTLIDVVGVVTLLASLGVERLVCSPLPLGPFTGAPYLQSAHFHGTRDRPPAPRSTRWSGWKPEAELVTPTSAALATVLADDWGPIPAMTLERDGFSASTI